MALLVGGLALAAGLMPTMASAADGRLLLEPTELQARGGTVMVGLEAPPNRCTLTLRPALGQPLTREITCGGGVRSRVALPANHSPTAMRYVISLRPRGWGSAIERRVTVPAALRVELFADSLGHQAAPYFAAVLRATGDTRVKLETFPGSSICGYLGEMRLDAAQFHPKAVVLQFSGDRFLNCAQRGASTRSSMYDQALAAVRILSKGGATRIYLVGTSTIECPLPHAPAGECPPAFYRQVNQAYDQLVRVTDRGPQRRLLRRISPGSALLTPSGQHFTDHLACLVHEPCLGTPYGRRTNWVRQVDGIHFCRPQWPKGSFPPQGCPSYSSGAYRYGASMASSVIADFGLGRVPDLHSTR